MPPISTSSESSVGDEKVGAKGAHSRFILSPMSVATAIIRRSTVTPSVMAPARSFLRRFCGGTIHNQSRKHR